LVVLKVAYLVYELVDQKVGRKLEKLDGKKVVPKETLTVDY